MKLKEMFSSELPSLRILTSSYHKIKNDFCVPVLNKKTKELKKIKKCPMLFKKLKLLWKKNCLYWNCEKRERKKESRTRWRRSLRYGRQLEIWLILQGRLHKNNDDLKYVIKLLLELFHTLSSVWVCNQTRIEEQLHLGIMNEKRDSIRLWLAQSHDSHLKW